jgi:RimJ/RimL family protein N-acetyltransferase
MDMADAARVALMCNEWDVARMLSLVAHPYAVSDAETWIARHPEGAETGSDFPFAVIGPNGLLIGCVGLTLKQAPAYEIGYWFGREAWGKGYATEAGQAIIAWARDILHAPRLTSAHFVDNPASGNVLKKLGFSYIGEDDHPCLARNGTVRAKLMERVFEPNEEGPP